MKLFNFDNAELMDVSELRMDDGNLIVVGTIMGAMPTEAVLTPAEFAGKFEIAESKVMFCVAGNAVQPAEGIKTDCVGAVWVARISKL